MTPPPTPVDRLQPPGPATLLLVEDDPQMGLIVALLCRPAGVGVVHVADGASAWAWLRDRVAGGLPDLVLLDINLPGLDGVEVCRRLKGDVGLRGVRVGLFVGAALAGDVARGWAAGADVLVVKDLVTRPEDFRRRLREVLPPGGGRRAGESLNLPVAGKGRGGILRSGHTSLRAWVAAVNEALPPLESRLPGHAVLVAVLDRALGQAGRVAAGAGVPPLADWLGHREGRFVVGEGSGRVRSATLAALLASLAGQGEGLLGAEACRPFRDALADLGLVTGVARLTPPRTGKTTRRVRQSPGGL